MEHRVEFFASKVRGVVFLANLVWLESQCDSEGSLNNERLNAVNRAQ
jgi:hypothetical protein